MRLYSQWDHTECLLEALEIPFILEDITQVPADSQFILNVEEKGGHIADKVRFLGVFSVSGIGLPQTNRERSEKIMFDVARTAKERHRYGLTFQTPYESVLLNSPYNTHYKLGPRDIR